MIETAVSIEVALLTCNNGMHISFFETQKEEITSCEERVKKLLELTPPKGKEFLHKIEHILEREKNWVSILLHSSSLCSLAQTYDCNLSLTLRICYHLLNPILYFLGVVETGWLPTIWKTTYGEENSFRCGQEAVCLFSNKSFIFVIMALDYRIRNLF